MKILKENNTAIIIPDGDIIGDAVVMFQTKLNETVENVSIIEINMENVNYAVSSFVPLIEEIHKKLSEKGGKLVLKNCNDRIKDLFHTISTTDIKIK